MARPWLLGLAGGLTLLVALLLFFPARIAYQWFAPPVAQASGFGGTIWAGSASEANVGGLYLRDLAWDVQALSLLTGKLALDFSASPASGFIEGRVAYGFTGTVGLSDVRASLPLEAVRGVAGNPGLGGTLSVDVQSLVIKDGIPSSGDGRFEVANLMDTRILPQSIGGYSGTLTSADGLILIQYTDTDGVIDIEGRIELDQAGRYTHTARMREKSNTPTAVRNFIRFQPESGDGSGWREAMLGEGQL